MVKSKVHAVLKRTRRTLTDAFRWLKHVLFLKQIELRLLRKRKKLAKKEKPLSVTLRKPRSEAIPLGDKSKGPTKAKAKKAKRSRKAADK